ncbi:hypothetical protein CEXT_690891 [Caerostris extrusa]|uniref:Uncharacterized protein n=1 Tax=Caerostris extrusa TaxID=172846 RepID=A0AAV4Y6X4_CAEEX|nr:hypothetical protein CEXT_690891 [Caerostris extrusa]
MEGSSNNNSDYKNKSTSPNFDNSTSRPGPSSASIPWQERGSDRKPPKKRSHTEANNWGRDKHLKSKSPDNAQNRELRQDEGKDIPNGDPIAVAQQQRISPAISHPQQIPATISHQQHISPVMTQQQQITSTIPHPQITLPPNQMMQQQPLPYQPYAYNGSENFVDPNQANYAMPHYGMMMNPVMEQWPMSNGIIQQNSVSMNPSAASINVSNGMDMAVSSTGASIGAYPYVNMQNDPNMYGVPPSCGNFLSLSIDEWC